MSDIYQLSHPGSSFSGRSGFQATSDPIAFDDDRLSPDDPRDLAHL